MTAPTINNLKSLLSDDNLNALCAGGVNLSIETTEGSRTITLSGTRSSSPQDRISVSASVDEGIELSGISVLENILGGGSFHNIIPPTIPLANTLALQDIKLSIDPNAKKIAVLVIDLSSSRKWEIMGDKFAIDSLTLSFVLSYPFASKFKVFTHIFGKFNIGSIELDAGIQLPYLMISAEMPAGKSVSLDGLIQDVFPNPNLQKQNFKATDLRLEVEPRQEKYSFQIQITDDWNILNKVNLTNLYLGISGTGTSKVDGKVTALLEIAKADLDLIADRDRTTGGWQFVGHTPYKNPIGKGSSSQQTSEPSKGKLQGGAEIAIGDLVADIADKFGVTVPKFIDSLTIDSLATSFDTETKDFTFTAELKSVGTIDFDVYHSPKIALANYSNSKGKDKLRLKTLVEQVDSSLAGSLPDIEITLNDALFADYNGKTLFGVDLGGGLNLSKLPLVGKDFSPDRTLKLSYQILVASGDFSKSEVKDLIAKIGNRLANLQEQAIAKGWDLQTSLRLGGKTVNANLPVQVESNGVTPTNNTQTSASQPEWFKLQKSFGPIHLQRVGLQYQDSDLWVLLDASLGLGGLSLDLNGLGVKSPLTPLEPTFFLEGLGVDFQEGPVEIGGAFLRKEVTKDGQTFEEYDGTAVIQVELEAGQLGLHAIGSYCYYENHPSLFLYLVVDFPMGGPPFFSVDAIAGGFGYNRALKVPTVGKLGQFPLVAEAVGGKPPSITGSASARAQVLENELNKLDTYIPPDVGSLFFALGVKFDSFKLIECFALLTLELGDRFEIDLLGVADISAPPDEEKGVTPLAEARMFLKASFIPAEGFLGVSAQLDPSRSYIISRSCHLTGGFAFYSWFAGEHEGDFVVTFGGYHPKFKAPKWYPSVPRLGVNWQIDSHCFVRGGCYFALCAHALMAGESLELSYHDGKAHASLQVGADFLICWKPFHYDIHVYVDVSASYWIFSADLGADLHIWGPEFGGTAKIKAGPFSFTINFGDSSSGELAPIDWSTFRKSFLPADDQICSIVAASGLTRQAQQDDKPLWIVNPKEFSFAVSSIIPTKKAVWASGKEIPVDNTCQEFGIRAMGVTSDSLQTTQRIEIVYLENNRSVSVEDQFKFESFQQKAPSAMWGEPNMDGSNLRKPSVNEELFVVKDGNNPLSGFKITSKPPLKPDHTNDIPTKEMRYSTDAIAKAYAWTAIAPFSATAQNDTSRRDTIRSQIGSSTARNQILQTLGFDPQRDVCLNSEALADSFVIAPQVGK